MKCFFIILISISCNHCAMLKFKRRNDKPCNDNKDVLGDDDILASLECTEDVPPDEFSDDIIIKSIKLPVDHFDETNKNKWEMRYYQNDAYFTSSSPIYIMVGGNEPTSPEYLSTGLMFELAKQTNGSMFANEHRYYGTTMMKDDTKTEAFEELTYLHSTQVLEDLKNLIAHLKQEPGYENSKVILFGGDYGGSLAAWMRIKNPDYVTAALASSAPLYATIEFDEFLIRAASGFAASVPLECMINIGYVFEFFVNTVKEGNFVELTDKGNICREVNMTVVENQQVLYFVEMFMFVANVEDGPDRMREACKEFEAHHENIIKSPKKPTSCQTRRCQAYRRQRFKRKQGECNNYDFEYFISQIQRPEEKLNRLWLYQCCNEFGHFPVSADVATNVSSISNFVLDRELLPSQFYYRLCSALFGEDFKEDTIKKKIAKTNERYGGRTPKNVSSIIFTHGTLDPWEALGYQDDNNPSVLTVIIEGAARCQDLKASNCSETKELKEIRTSIMQYMIEILQNSSFVDTEQTTTGPETVIDVCEMF